jgi:hypothetical protein
MVFKYLARFIENSRDHEKSSNIIGQFRQVIKIARGTPANYKQ